VSELSVRPARPGRLEVQYEGAGFTEVSRLLLEGLTAQIPPAVAMRVSADSRFGYAAAGGWANLGLGASDPVPANSGTLFDLASLTKVIATVPLVLLLHQRGAWNIDDPIARWLPDAPASDVTIRQCLTHTSGLVPHRPFFAEQPGPAEIRKAVTAELAVARGGPGPVSYSDLGYMLLGWAAEYCAGEPLEVLVSREILGPLGMASTGYRPAVRRTRIAATEADGDQRLGSAVRGLASADRTSGVCLLGKKNPDYRPS
jgi:serine-type D-Ala-D-Ala carboxypeptidase